MPRRPRVALLCLTLTAALVAPLFFLSAPAPNSRLTRATSSPAPSPTTRLVFAPAAASASSSASDDALASSSAAQPEFYRRTRSLQLDSALARAATRDPSAQIGQRWRFELFDDLAWDGLVARAESVGPERVNLYGQLEGIPGSDFIVTLHGDAAAAMSFTHPGLPGRYQVRTVAPGQLVAIELAPELLPPCALDPATHPSPTPALAAEARQHATLHARVAADLNLPGSSYGSFGQQGGSADGLTFTNVDVMIAYTAAAQSGAGGAAGVLALCDHMVARANATFINSRVGLRLRLVRAEAVAYTEPGNINTDLDRLTNTSDGFLDALHATRTAVGADLVTLLTENTGGSASGLAWLYTGGGGSAGYGFNVVQRAGCESTFVHEIGHNFGCEHDRGNTDGDDFGSSIYPYAYGHRFAPAGYGQLRTVMAYAPGDRIPYFSNPDVTYLGASTGVALGQPGQAHNAQVLNNTKASLAAFRATAGNQPPSVTLTAPTVSTALVALDDVTLTATATDADGTIAAVRFYQLAPDSDWNFTIGATVSLGADTTTPYAQSVTDVPAGYITFAAVAADNQGAVSTSTVSVTVAPWYRQDLLTMPVGYESSLDLVGINSTGQIAGTVTSAANLARAVRWTGVTPTLLAPLAGDVRSVALAIGEDGTVYGESIGSNFVYRAVRWSPAGVATDLSAAVPGQFMESAFGQDASGRSLYALANGRGYRDSTATPINFKAQAIASSGIVGGYDYDSGPDAWRAARWDGGASTLLAPQAGFATSWGLDVNRSGAVVGVSSPSQEYWDSTIACATYWPAGATAPTDVAPVGSTSSVAEGLNDHDEIVGYSGSSFSVPFLWRSDLGAIDLTQVLLPSPDADLRRARAINNRGMIAVEGFNGADFAPFRLTPVTGLSHRHWTSTHFSLVELDAAVLTGDSADPDGDGLPNLIERAFNLNPRAAQSAYSGTGYPALAWNAVAGKPTLTFRRLRGPSDVTYTVEATSNLAGAWSSAGAVEVSRTAIDADWDEVVYQSAASPAPGAPVFLRVRVGR